MDSENNCINHILTEVVQVATCYKHVARNELGMNIKTDLKGIAEKYLEACRSIKHLVKASGREPDYFIKGLGLSKTTYYRKLRNKDWSPGELIRFNQLLNADDKA